MPQQRYYNRISTSLPQIAARENTSQPEWNQSGLGNAEVCIPPLNRRQRLATGGRMHLETKKKTDSDAVPLLNAVLCVDCECVTDGRFDKCLVCGSRSLLSIAKIVGGTLLTHEPNGPRKDQDIVQFDLEITIALRQIEPKDLSAAVESITSLIGPSLGRGRACCHINVEPVMGSCTAQEPKAA